MKAGCACTPALNLEMQHAAQQAVRDGLAAYERRHGWKGNLLNVVANGESLATLSSCRLGRRALRRQLRSCAGDRREPMARRVKFGRLRSAARAGRDQVDAAHVTRADLQRRAIWCT